MHQLSLPLIEGDYQPEREWLVASSIGWLVLDRTNYSVTIAPDHDVYAFREGTPVSVSIQTDSVETTWGLKSMTLHVPAMPLMAQLEQWVGNWETTEKLYQIEFSRSKLSRFVGRLAALFQ